MAELKLKGLYKVYENGVVAVNDFTMDIHDKEFIVLVGPSGCGKTTTLRMIAGLERISDGDLFIGEKRVNDVEPKDRDIAMVFQNYALYPHMTVRKNMSFGLKLRKTPDDVIKNLVSDAAKLLEIEPYFERKPKMLSGGQRQRVAIGRAIVRIPQVFLMDEPLSNLDAKLRNQMRAELILLRKRIDTTFVYVTHDQTEAMTLGDRIVVMKDGFIQQIGTPQEVFNHPANTFVAGFIGTPQMNFFEGTLNPDMSVTICGEKCLLDEKAIAKLKESTSASHPVTVGIRPEHLFLTDKKGPNVLEGTILVSEMMGSEIHLHVMTSEEKGIIIRLQTIDLSENELENLRSGGKVLFSWPSRLMQLFDCETTQSLLK